MSGDGPAGGRVDPDFRAARIGAAVALTITLIVLLVVDAFSPTYDISAVVLGGILTAVLTLLGIEAGAALIGRRR